MDFIKKYKLAFFALFVFFVFGLFIYSGLFFSFLKSVYVAAPVDYLNAQGEDTEVLGQKEEVFTPPPPAHVETPGAVKAVYMTSCVAATPNWRTEIMKMIEETELNSIVIDIKDYSGTISFESDNPQLADNYGDGCRVKDMKEFVEELHSKGIYVIGRITVFQDAFYTKKRPDLTVKKASDKNVVWKDYKGISFIEVGAMEFWEYIVEIAKESYNTIGFDELNFDYIRFPSDGNMKDIYYPFSEEQVVEDPDFGKAKVLREFFTYLYTELEDTGAVLSADLFGMTMTNSDDLNIGQILEYAEPFFDYIAPMVYPSHYPRGFRGYTNVNAHPYDIVKFSMAEGVRRLEEASSTPSKLRPWIQDFDYPVVYTPDMVRKQKQAVYDIGLTSWMMWDPANKYTRSALDEALD
jgi:hypothetical protein